MVKFVGSVATIFTLKKNILRFVHLQQYMNALYGTFVKDKFECIGVSLNLGSI